MGPSKTPIVSSREGISVNQVTTRRNLYQSPIWTPTKWPNGHCCERINNDLLLSVLFYPFTNFYNAMEKKSFMSLFTAQGETAEIAEEMAARDALRRIFR